MKSKRFLLLMLILIGGVFLLFECVDRRTSADQVDQAQMIDTMHQKAEVYNRLSEVEIEDGWDLLFNGSSLSGWRGFNKEVLNDSWIVKDGNLVSQGRGGDIGGDIITVEQYENFELKLEWKISPEGNSGIFFHVLEGNYEAVYFTGPEYQIIDDLSFPDPLEDWQTTGANYGMHSPNDAKIKPVGEWNSSRIVVNNAHVEHWLNGVKVVEYTLWDEQWNLLVRQGKWKDYPDYGQARKGHIGLQDHGSRTWFRNIKIKSI